MRSSNRHDPCTKGRKSEGVKKLERARAWQKERGKEGSETGSERSKRRSRVVGSRYSRNGMGRLRGAYSSGLGGGMLAELPWQHGGSQRRIQCEPQRMQGDPAISGPCFSALTPLSHAEKGAPPADHCDYCSTLHNLR